MRQRSDLQQGFAPESNHAIFASHKTRRNASAGLDRRRHRGKTARDQPVNKSPRLGAVSYRLLFVNRSTAALAAAKEALSLDPSPVWIETNRARALLFLGRFHEAEAVYLEHKDKPLSDTRNVVQAVKADFVEFRKFGIDTLEMKRIEALLPQ